MSSLDIVNDRSPLEQIEEAAQSRAKLEHLDVTSDQGLERLHELLVQEVSAWSEAFSRGTLGFDISDPQMIIDRASRNIVSYGPLSELLDDEDVWEIMINAPDSIFVKRHRGQSGYHHEVFHDDAHVLRTLSRLVDDASGAHRKLDPAEGLQDARLDNGSRVHIVHADIGRDNHILVNIRKFTGVPFRTLDDLVTQNMLPSHAAEILRMFVKAKLSIVFAGAPGAGKTTLLSCCAAELDPRWRVVIAEEVFESDVPLPNVAHMQTRAARNDRPEVDLRKLVSGFLRMAPDIAIVGEVRDREAMPLLLTFSSGVKGFTTIHAGSARQALSRLRFICQLSDAGQQMPIGALNHLVSESIDVVVHTERIDGTPRISEIICVEDSQSSEAMGFTWTSLFKRGANKELEWTGNVPIRVIDQLDDAGFDLVATLNSKTRIKPSN